MEELALTACMATMLVIAMVCTIIFKKIKLPAIVGYLATGIIMANYFSAYDGTNTQVIVGLLSNLGLALLMFSIGMELNFDKLRKSGAFAVLVVMVQVPIVIIAGILFGTFLHWDSVLSICMGAILAGSSTAVVLVVQKEKQVLPQSDVDALLLILVVEDVSQVIMMSVLTPMLGSGTMATLDLVLLIVKIIAFMCIATFVGIRFVPRLLNWIGDKMNNEILIISALAMCFLLAFLSVEIGMSMAVGAFLMGVIVSQCKHCEHIGHSIEPMKDIFMAMFFISIGLEVNPSDLVANLGLMVGIFLLFVIARSIAVYLGFFLGNKDPRLSFMSATSMLTMGEFAFIISSMAFEAGVMDKGVHAAVIGAALISMVAQSFITGAAGKIYDSVDAHLPSPVKKLNAKIFSVRDRAFHVFGTLSKNTAYNLKKLLVFVYFSGLILAVVIAVFYYYGTAMATFLEQNISFFTAYDALLVIRIVEFVVLLIPLSIFILNVKSLVRHFTLAEEMEWDVSKRKEEYLLRSTDINLWIPTFFLDFIVLLLIPSKLSLLDHLAVSIIGIIIFLVIWVLKFKKTKNETDSD